jgi:hypothetical protein
MKMIPNRIPELSTKDREDRKLLAGWKGEKKVFELLHEVDRLGTVLYRKRIRNHHKWKQSAEADFVLLLPEGVFVLEVKSGMHIRVNETGQWYDKDRPMKEAPWDQAEGNQFALCNYLNDQKVVPPPFISWGVILVNVDYPPATPNIEVPAQAVMSARQIRKGHQAMKAYIEGLIKVQIGRRQIRPMKTPELVHLTHLLGPPYDLRPSLATRYEDEKTRELELTNGQFNLLHYRSDMPRQIIEGGAGTGKTFIALELAKQKAEQGMSVLFVVRSEGLARFLKSKCNQEITVKTARDLRSQISNREPFDFLVVDEGQDLLEENIIDDLFDYLKDGLLGGEWWWFMDTSNQAGIYSDTDLELAKYLEDATGGARSFKLDKNCRNTKEIVEYLQDHLCADIGNAPTEGSGFKPRVHKLSNKTRRVEIKRALEKCLTNHFNEPTLSNGQLSIVVIGEAAWASDLIDELDRPLRRKVRRFAYTDTDSWPPTEKVVYCTPEEIKGLENDCIVVLTDPSSDLDMTEIVAQTYIALTRPRVSLDWIVKEETIQMIMALSKGTS